MNGENKIYQRENISKDFINYIDKYNITNSNKKQEQKYPRNKQSFSRYNRVLKYQNSSLQLYNISTIKSMSEVDQLIGLISNILQGEDKAVRESAEKNIVDLRTANPNELMLAFLAILIGQYQIQHRNFAATQLRLCLSEFSPATYTNLWPNITPETQNHIKVQLFKVLFAEPEPGMKKHIADTLGEIAASILTKDVNAWPEFKNNLWALFRQSSLGGLLSGFNVLESFLPFCPEVFSQNVNELFVLFQGGLKHENNNIRLSALNAFSSYLQILEPKDQKNFKLLIPDIFNTVYILITKDNNEEGLQNLSEMLDIDPKFFKQNFKELYELLQTIFSTKNVEGGVKRMATQILVDFSEKSPKIFRKNKQYLNGLLQMIFSHMVDIDNEVSAEWMKPEEGYNDDMEDDDDFETTRFGMGAIDRIIFSVGDKQVLPILSEAIKQLLKSLDWRYLYTAVMALSQVGEYIEDATNVSSIIEMILKYFNHENPMLRYAACHAIGQISDDMKPKYQELYGKQTYPHLVHLLKDPVPRVVSHSAAALTNFLEGLTYEQAQPHLTEMMELLVVHSNNGISLVKESCLGAISSVAQMCKQNFANYIEVTVQLLFHIIETHTSREYKQLRGQAIQTLTIIASSVGANAFRPAVQKLINIMILIQESKFEQVDPQKSYILAGWQRLFLVYGQQLAGYLNRILPSLFELVRNVINNELNLVKNPEPQEEDKQKSQKEQSINTFETQEAEVAISMLNVFIEQLKELYSPYVEQTVALLCKIIKQHLNDDVREEACNCLPSLVSAIKLTNKDGAIQMTKYFMATLVETIEKETDPNIVCIQLETLKSVIEDLGLSFLSASEIEQFSKKMLTMLHNCEQTKLQTKSFMTNTEGQQLDEDQTELFNEQIKQEEEVQVSISEVFGILFKTHLDMAMPIALHLITQVLPNVLKPKMSENSYKFAIFMIDDMVEFLGFNRLQQHWEQFGKVLLGFCQEKSCELRQAACYGLGVYASSTPTGAVSSQIVQNWLQALLASAAIPKGAEKEKSFGHCRDNAISSIGKIIKHHAEAIGSLQNCIDFWVNYLPLKFDKPEAIIQHEFFIDILLNKPELILGNGDVNQKLANLVRTLSILGTILNNHKIYNDDVKNKIKNYVLSLRQNGLFVDNYDKIWQNLGVKQKQSLTKLTS